MRSLESSPTDRVRISARPAGARTAAAPVLSLQQRAGNRMVQRAVRAAVMRRVSDPFADEAATDEKSAAAAMKAYSALPDASRRIVVWRADRAKVARVLAALAPSDQIKTYRVAIQEILRWVQEDTTRTAARMTDEEMAIALRDFVLKQAEDAAARKKAVDAAAATIAGTQAANKPPEAKPSVQERETARKTVVASTSVKPPGQSRWDAMSPAEQAAWTDRGRKAVEAVVAHAKVEHPELALSAEHFRVAFKDVESRGANVFAFGESDGTGGTRAGIGFAFVRAVELNPAYVMDVVVHELAGHPEYGVYGSEYHLELYDAAMATMPGYVKPADGSAERRTELDAYAYPETEIYAVLRGMRYRTRPTPDDEKQVPNLDTLASVTYRVGLMKKQWPPKLIVPILRGLRARLHAEPRISGPAINVFDKAVLANFDEATLAEIKP